MEELLTVLEDYGLSDKEAQVYLSALRLGTPTANAIAEHTGLNRSTVYDVLRALVTRGLIAKSIKDKTTCFEAASPERLLSLLDEKKHSLNRVLDKLKEEQNRVVKKPLVRIFQGPKGVRTLLQEILDKGENTDVISTSKVFTVLMYAFPHYITERKERGIHARVIQEDSKETRALKKSDKHELRKTKSLKNYTASSMTFIYGDTLALIKLVREELVALVITDKVLADDKRETFEILWNVAR